MPPGVTIATGFFTSAAAGILGALLLVPFAALGRFFFALNAGLAFAALALASPWLGLGRSGGTAAEAASAAALGIAALVAIALTLAYLAALYLPRRRERRGLLAAAAASAFVVAALVGQQAGYGSGWVGATGAVSGAILLGSVVVAMNLGHWYLVKQRLPVAHLVRFSLVLAAAVALRAVVLVLGLAVTASRSPLGMGAWLEMVAVDRGFFFWQRVFFGILGPALLAWMVHATARIRSTQSATGILYIAVIFVVIGEFLARFLAPIGAGPI